MRCLIWGDGRWAAEVLEQLCGRGHKVAGVVLKRIPSDDALERAAAQLGIDTVRPDDANSPDMLAWVRRREPDLNVAVFYDQVIRRDLRLTAPLGFTNVHPGKLPWYRGRSSVHWAIINNECELGVTVHLMNDGIDTGDILVQRTLPILWEDTYGSMMTKLRAIVPGIVMEAVDGLTAGTIHPTPQPPLGSYYGVRRSGDEWIDWRQSSLRIYNTIRGIAPPGPCARTRLGDQTIMVRAARYDSAWPCYDGAAGEVVGREADGPRVKTGDSTIVLTSLVADDSNDRERPIRLAVGLRLLPRDELKQLRDEVAALRAEVSRLLPR